MWENIFHAAVSSGIWAIMFCALLVYQLKDSRKREEQYQATIERLSKSLEGISNGLDNINRGLEGIFEVKGMVGHILDKLEDAPIAERKPRGRPKKGGAKQWYSDAIL